MKPPASIRFMGRRLPIKVVPDLIVNERKCGDWSEANATIRVDPAQSSVDFRDTVLHEVLHAISTYTANKLTERQVLTTASALLAIFDDNPAFAKFILTKSA